MSDTPGAFSPDGDGDRAAAYDGRTTAAQLADIAARRWDLHPAILTHPQAYPELQAWIVHVNPASAQTPLSYGQPPAGTAPRRRGAGWFVGCGCVSLVALMVILLVVFGALGVLGSLDGGTSSGTSSSDARQPDLSPTVETALAEFETERALYYELRAQIDGSPAAPLVSKQRTFEYLESQAASPALNEYTAAPIPLKAREIREELQQIVAAAQTRRTNASGTLVEELIDSAGGGLIDVAWDAASACDASTDGWTTTGCVRGDNPLLIHVEAESEFTNDWHRRMLVAHELAHVFQTADRARFSDQRGYVDQLIDQGLFQGGEEQMADCYALTFYGEWSLTNANVETGYGYVCGEAERQAIREWSADINAPMPG